MGEARRRLVTPQGEPIATEEDKARAAKYLEALGQVRTVLGMNELDATGCEFIARSLVCDLVPHVQPGMEAQWIDAFSRAISGDLKAAFQVVIAARQVPPPPKLQ